MSYSGGGASDTNHLASRSSCRKVSNSCNSAGLSSRPALALASDVSGAGGLAPLEFPAAELTTPGDVALCDPDLNLALLSLRIDEFRRIGATGFVSELV
jgi:hypothetical protein